VFGPKLTVSFISTISEYGQRAKVRRDREYVAQETGKLAYRQNQIT
jgi:hypothetical protein